MRNIIIRNVITSVVCVFLSSVAHGQNLQCEELPDCSTLGFEQDITCAEGAAIGCPYDASYKKCVNVSCRDLGYTQDSKLTWCKTIITCPTDSTYTLCAESCNSVCPAGASINPNCQYGRDPVDPIVPIAVGEPCHASCFACKSCPQDAQRGWDIAADKCLSSQYAKEKLTSFCGAPGTKYFCEKCPTWMVAEGENSTSCVCNNEAGYYDTCPSTMICEDKASLFGPCHKAVKPKPGYAIAVEDVDGSIVAYITSDGTIIDPDGNVIGHVAETVVYDEDGNAIGYVGDDGHTVYDFEGNVIGEVSGNGTVTDSNGNVIGHTGDSVVYDFEGNVIGYVVDGDVVDINGNHVGSIQGDGTVIDDNGNIIGTTNLVYDEDGNVIGYIGEDGVTAFDFDGNVIGTLQDDGTVKNGDDIIGRTADKVIIDQEGNVVGFVDKDGGITPLNDQEQTYTVPNKTCNSNSQCTGLETCVSHTCQGSCDKMGVCTNNTTTNLVYDASGNVIGYYDPLTGKAYTFDGTLIGDVQKNNGIVKKDGVVVGFTADSLAYDENGTFIGFVVGHNLVDPATGQSIGQVHSDGLIVDSNGNVIGTTNLVYDKNGNVIGYYGPECSTAYNFSGAVIGEAQADGTIKKNGVIVGYAANSVLYQQNSGDFYAFTLKDLAHLKTCSPNCDSTHCGASCGIEIKNCADYPYVNNNLLDKLPQNAHVDTTGDSCIVYKKNNDGSCAIKERRYKNFACDTGYTLDNGGCKKICTGDDCEDPCDAQHCTTNGNHCGTTMDSCDAKYQYTSINLPQNATLSGSTCTTSGKSGNNCTTGQTKYDNYTCVSGYEKDLVHGGCGCTGNGCTDAPCDERHCTLNGNHCGTVLNGCGDDYPYYTGSAALAAIDNAVVDITSPSCTTYDRRNDESCMPSRTQYKGFKCKDGYVKSCDGKSCIVGQSCKDGLCGETCSTQMDKCKDYLYPDRLPQNAHVDTSSNTCSIHKRNDLCYQCTSADVKYDGFACDTNYTLDNGGCMGEGSENCDERHCTKGGNHCGTVVNACGNYIYRSDVHPANGAPSMSSGSCTTYGKNADNSCGDASSVWYKDYTCDKNYTKDGNGGCRPVTPEGTCAGGGTTISSAPNKVCTAIPGVTLGNDQCYNCVCDATHCNHDGNTDCSVKLNDCPTNEYPWTATDKPDHSEVSTTAGLCTIYTKSANHICEANLVRYQDFECNTGWKKSADCREDSSNPARPECDEDGEHNAKKCYAVRWRINGANKYAADANWCGDGNGKSDGWELDSTHKFGKCGDEDCKLCVAKTSHTIAETHTIDGITYNKKFASGAEYCGDGTGKADGWYLDNNTTNGGTVDRWCGDELCKLCMPYTSHTNATTGEKYTIIADNCGNGNGKADGWYNTDELNGTATTAGHWCGDTACKLCVAKTVQKPAGQKHTDILGFEDVAKWYVSDVQYCHETGEAGWTKSDSIKNGTAATAEHWCGDEECTLCLPKTSWISSGKIKYAIHADYCGDESLGDNRGKSDGWHLATVMKYGKCGDFDCQACIAYTSHTNGKKHTIDGVEYDKQFASAPERCHVTKAAGWYLSEEINTETTNNRWCGDTLCKLCMPYTSQTNSGKKYTIIADHCGDEVHGKSDGWYNSTDANDKYGKCGDRDCVLCIAKTVQKDGAKHTDILGFEDVEKWYVADVAACHTTGSTGWTMSDSIKTATTTNHWCGDTECTLCLPKTSQTENGNKYTIHADYCGDETTGKSNGWKIVASIKYSKCGDFDCQLCEKLHCAAGWGVVVGNDATYQCVSGAITTNTSDFNKYHGDEKCLRCLCDHQDGIKEHYAANPDSCGTGVGKSDGWDIDTTKTKGQTASSMCYLCVAKTVQKPAGQKHTDLVGFENVDKWYASSATYCHERGITGWYLHQTATNSAAETNKYCGDALCKLCMPYTSHTNESTGNKYTIHADYCGDGTGKSNGWYLDSASRYGRCGDERCQLCQKRDCVTGWGIAAGSGANECASGAISTTATDFNNYNGDTKCMRCLCDHAGGYDKEAGLCHTTGAAGWYLSTSDTKGVTGNDAKTGADTCYKCLAYNCPGTGGETTTHYRSTATQCGDGTGNGGWVLDTTKMPTPPLNTHTGDTACYQCTIAQCRTDAGFVADNVELCGTKGSKGYTLDTIDSIHPYAGNTACKLCQANTCPCNTKECNGGDGTTASFNYRVCSAVTNVFAGEKQCYDCPCNENSHNAYPGFKQQATCESAAGYNAYTECAITETSQGCYTKTGCKQGYHNDENGVCVVNTCRTDEGYVSSADPGADRCNVNGRDPSGLTEEVRNTGAFGYVTKAGITTGSAGYVLGNQDTATDHAYTGQYECKLCTKKGCRDTFTTGLIETHKVCEQDTAAGALQYDGEAACKKCSCDTQNGYYDTDDACKNAYNVNNIGAKCQRDPNTTEPDNNKKCFAVLCNPAEFRYDTQAHCETLTHKGCQKTSDNQCYEPTVGQCKTGYCLNNAGSCEKCSCTNPDNGAATYLTGACSTQTLKDNYEYTDRTVVRATNDTGTATEKLACCEEQPCSTSSYARYTSKNLCEAKNSQNQYLCADYTRPCEQKSTDVSTYNNCTWSCQGDCRPQCQKNATSYTYHTNSSGNNVYRANNTQIANATIVTACTYKTETCGDTTQYGNDFTCNGTYCKENDACSAKVDCASGTYKYSNTTVAGYTALDGNATGKDSCVTKVRNEDGTCNNGSNGIRVFYKDFTCNDGYCKTGNVCDSVVTCDASTYKYSSVAKSGYTTLPTNATGSGTACNKKLRTATTTVCNTSDTTNYYTDFVCNKADSCKRNGACQSTSNCNRTTYKYSTSDSTVPANADASGNYCQDVLKNATSTECYESDAIYYDNFTCKANYCKENNGCSSIVSCPSSTYKYSNTNVSGYTKLHSQAVGTGACDTKVRNTDGTCNNASDGTIHFFSDFTCNEGYCKSGTKCESVVTCDASTYKYASTATTGYTTLPAYSTGSGSSCTKKLRANTTTACDTTSVTATFYTDFTCGAGWHKVNGACVSDGCEGGSGYEGHLETCGTSGALGWQLTNVKANMNGSIQCYVCEPKECATGKTTVEQCTSRSDKDSSGWSLGADTGSYSGDDKCKTCVAKACAVSGGKVYTENKSHCGTACDNGEASAIGWNLTTATGTTPLLGDSAATKYCTAKSCSLGYATTGSACTSGSLFDNDSFSGWSGNDKCYTCACKSGSYTAVSECPGTKPQGYTAEQCYHLNGTISSYSGSNSCQACVANSCPSGSATTVVGWGSTGESGWQLGTTPTGCAGDKLCYTPVAKSCPTDTYTSGNCPDGYESIVSEDDILGYTGNTPCYGCAAVECRTNGGNQYCASVADCGETGSSGWILGTDTNGKCGSTDCKLCVAKTSQTSGGITYASNAQYCGPTGTAGWELNPSTTYGWCGDAACQKCVDKNCPSGSETNAAECSDASGSNWVLDTNSPKGYSGNKVCYTCTKGNCPANSYVEGNCPDGYESIVSEDDIIGYTGNTPCYGCNAVECRTNGGNQYCASVEDCVGTGNCGWVLGTETNGRCGTKDCKLCVAKTSQTIGGITYASNAQYCPTTGAAGFELNPSITYGDAACQGCVAKNCPSGSATTVAGCGSTGAKGWSLGAVVGYSGNDACYRCVPNATCANTVSSKGTKHNLGTSNDVSTMMNWMIYTLGETTSNLSFEITTSDHAHGDTQCYEIVPNPENPLPGKVSPTGELYSSQEACEDAHPNAVCVERERYMDEDLMSIYAYTPVCDPAISRWKPGELAACRQNSGYRACNLLDVEYEYRLNDNSIQETTQCVLPSDTTCYNSACLLKQGTCQPKTCSDTSKPLSGDCDARTASNDNIACSSSVFIKPKNNDCNQTGYATMRCHIDTTCNTGRYSSSNCHNACNATQYCKLVNGNDDMSQCNWSCANKCPSGYTPGNCPSVGANQYCETVNSYKGDGSKCYKITTCSSGWYEASNCGSNCSSSNNEACQKQATDSHCNYKCKKMCPPSDNEVTFTSSNSCWRWDGYRCQWNSGNCDACPGEYIRINMPDSAATLSEFWPIENYINGGGDYPNTTSFLFEDYTGQNPYFWTVNNSGSVNGICIRNSVPRRQSYLWSWHYGQDKFANNQQYCSSVAGGAGWGVGPYDDGYSPAMLRALAMTSAPFAMLNYYQQSTSDGVAYKFVYPNSEGDIQWSAAQSGWQSGDYSTGNGVEFTWCVSDPDEGAWYPCSLCRELDCPSNSTTGSCDTSKYTCTVVGYNGNRACKSLQASSCKGLGSSWSESCGLGYHSTGTQTVSGKTCYNCQKITCPSSGYAETAAGCGTSGENGWTINQSDACYTGDTMKYKCVAKACARAGNGRPTSTTGLAADCYNVSINGIKYFETTVGYDTLHDPQKGTHILLQPENSFIDSTSVPATDSSGNAIYSGNSRCYTCQPKSCGADYRIWELYSMNENEHTQPCQIGIFGSAPHNICTKGPKGYETPNPGWVFYAIDSYGTSASVSGTRVYTPGYETYNLSSSNPKYYEYGDSYGPSLCYIAQKRDCPSTINDQTGIKAGIKGCGNGYNGIAPENAWVHTPVELPSSALAYNVISKTGWIDNIIPSEAKYAYSGNDQCGTCTPRACPTGYATSVEGCRVDPSNTNEGWHLGSVHTTDSYGTTPCYECVKDPCPSTDSTKSATTAAGCGTTGTKGWKILNWLEAKKIVNGTLTDQPAYSGADKCYMCIPFGMPSDEVAKLTPYNDVRFCGLSGSKGWSVIASSVYYGDTRYYKCNAKSCPSGQYTSASSCPSPTLEEALTVFPWINQSEYSHSWIGGEVAETWKLVYPDSPSFAGDTPCGTCELVDLKRCPRGYAPEGTNASSGTDLSQCGEPGKGGDKSGWQSSSGDCAAASTNGSSICADGRNCAMAMINCYSGYPSQNDYFCRPCQAKTCGTVMIDGEEVQTYTSATQCTGTCIGHWYLSYSSSKSRDGATPRDYGWAGDEPCGVCKCDACPTGMIHAYKIKYSWNYNSYGTPYQFADGCVSDPGPDLYACGQAGAKGWKVSSNHVGNSSGTTANCNTECWGCNKLSGYNYSGGSTTTYSSTVKPGKEASCGSKGAIGWEIVNTGKWVGNDGPSFKCQAKSCPYGPLFGDFVAYRLDSCNSGEVEDPTWFNSKQAYSGNQRCIRCLKNATNIIGKAAASQCYTAGEKGYNVFTKYSDDGATVLNNYCQAHDCTIGITKTAFDTVLSAGYYPDITPHMAMQSSLDSYNTGVYKGSGWVSGSATGDTDEKCKKWGCEAGYCGMSTGCVTPTGAADCPYKKTGYTWNSTIYSMSGSCDYVRDNTSTGNCTAAVEGYTDMECKSGYCRQGVYRSGNDGGESCIAATRYSNHDFCIDTSNHQACTEVSRTVQQAQNAPCDPDLIGSYGYCCDWNHAECYTGDVTIPRARLSDGTCGSKRYYSAWKCNTPSSSSYISCWNIQYKGTKHAYITCAQPNKNSYIADEKGMCHSKLTCGTGKCQDFDTDTCVNETTCDSSYDLTACPEHGICETTSCLSGVDGVCNRTTKYKWTGCVSGYHMCTTCRYHGQCVEDGEGCGCGPGHEHDGSPY